MAYHIPQEEIRFLKRENEVKEKYIIQLKKRNRNQDCTDDVFETKDKHLQCRKKLQT